MLTALAAIACVFAQADELPAPAWTPVKGAFTAGFGPWEKRGVRLTATEDWERGAFVSVIAAGVFSLDGLTRVYYTVYHGGKGFKEKIAVADLYDDGRTVKRPLEIDLPPETHPSLPAVVRDGQGWKLFFWLYGEGKAPRLARMVTADSADGVVWKLGDWKRPVLVYYNDPLALDGTYPRARQANDASSAYATADGWDIYSPVLVDVPTNSPRYVKQDLVAGRVRVMRRWEVGRDGTVKGPFEVATPDEFDPPDLQFYDFSRIDFASWRFGFLGRYACARQQISMEPVCSLDGRTWLRPLRANVFPLGKTYDAYMAIPAGTIFEQDGLLHVFYSAGNADHNFKTADGSPPAMVIAEATLDRHRLFSQSTESGTLVSPEIVLPKRLKVYLGDGSTADLSADDWSVRLQGSDTSPAEVTLTPHLVGRRARLSLSGRYSLHSVEMWD